MMNLPQQFGTYTGSIMGCRRCEAYKLRGNRNESSYIPYIIEKIALARGITMDEVARQTTDNAERVFFGNDI